MERGVLWAIVHGVAKNGTGLSGEHTNTHTHTHTHTRESARPAKPPVFTL